MGILDCRKHGYTGFNEVCEHVKTDLDAGSMAEMHVLQTGGPELVLCPECYYRTGLQRLEGIDMIGMLEDLIRKYPDDEDNEEMAAFKKLEADYYESYRNVNRSCICHLCFEEWRSQHPEINAWGTASAKQQREIAVVFEEIGPYLEAYAELPEETFFYIVPGSEDRPMVLSFYYITDIAQQDVVLHKLKTLAGQLRQQKLARFYEADLYEEIQYPLHVAKRRLAPVLLREIAFV